MSDHPEEQPPVFSSWRAWYRIVIGALVVQVILYYIITIAFS